MVARPKNSLLIYVLGQEDGAYIKIGKTRNPLEVRLRQHEYRGPEEQPMRPLALLWGMDSDEKALKRHWKALATNRGGEWLYPRQELRDWIRFLRQQSFVATNVDVLDDTPYVDPRYWLPRKEHAVAAKQATFKFNNDPWADLDFEEEVGDGDFYTSRIIIEAARQTMGRIELDPASCRMANTVVRATRYYGAAQDGLVLPWDAATVWLNPPFNQWDVWVPKLLDELHKGTVEQMCVLVPTRSLTAKACHPMLAKSASVAILNGRIPFWGPKAGSPDDGHAILYFGPNVSHFHLAFAPIAVTFETTMPHLKRIAA